MDFKLANNLISSYKRLSYKAWYAMAEFIDNSTQAYFDNKDTLDKQLKKEGTSLVVKVNYSSSEDKITIRDNSIGMNYDELTKALTLGSIPNNTAGRSKYGLGMKTAACWFGDKWYIKTKKLGETRSIKVSVDVEKIVQGDTNLPEEFAKADEDEHYTEIVITELNSKLRTTTISKIKEYLQSMYRIDFSEYGLQLYWQGDLLRWEDLKENLYLTANGKPYLKELDFSVGEKRVTGWVGVLTKGKSGRKNAGFSIIQSNRVIEGWPKGYKPTTVFGDQEGGTNDLVNQRLTGELRMDDFAVSHTKDAILWQDNEQEDLEEILYDECKDAIHLAKTVRFNKERDQNGQLKGYSNEAIETLNHELVNTNVRDYLESVNPPPEEIIKKSYNRIEDSIISSIESSMSIIIGHGTSKISVNVFFSENSEYEPYAVIELNTETDSLNVIINTIHPYYLGFANTESVLNFIRHCIYDGVAEWKAIKLIGSIQPNTVKFIKDGLLRLPFKIINE